MALDARFSIWGVLKEVWRAIGDKSLSHIAAGVAFYMLFAIFPAMVVGVAAIGLVFEPADALELVEFLEPFLPAEAYTLIENQARNTIASGAASLQLTAGVSFLLAFWSAAGAVRGLVTAMKLAHPASKRYGMIGYYLISLGVTLVAVCAVIAAIGLVLLLPPAINAFKLAATDLLLPNTDTAALTPVSENTLNLLEIPVMIAVGAVLLTVLYRLGAARGANAWAAARRGAIAATIIWAVGSKLLSIYVSEFADFTKTYGPLGAVAGLMLWFWLSAFVLLVGAEIAAALTDSERPSGKPAPS